MRALQRFHKCPWACRSVATKPLDDVEPVAYTPRRRRPLPPITTNPHHESALGSLFQCNSLAIHKKVLKPSWHAASRYTSCAVNPNLGQLENKRWVLFFAQRVRDDRHLTQRLHFSFLVSQLEGFVEQMTTLQQTKRRLLGDVAPCSGGVRPGMLLSTSSSPCSLASGEAAATELYSDNGSTSVSGGTTTFPTATTKERPTAAISDVEVHNLFYFELSRQLPLLEEAITEARLPHLVRFITLFKRVSIPQVPTVQGTILECSSSSNEEEMLDMMPESEVGQTLRLALLVENTLAEIEEKTQATLQGYATLSKRERVTFDNSMIQLHDAVQFFGPAWFESVFGVSSNGEERFPTLTSVFTHIEASIGEDNGLRDSVGRVEGQEEVTSLE